MNFLGIIFAIICFLVFRSIFALFIGYALGAFISSLKSPKRIFDTNKTIHSEFFQETLPAQKFITQAIFATMGHIAKAKGIISQADIAYAEQMMAQMHLPHDARKEAITAFNRGKQADFYLQGLLKEVYQHFHNNQILLQIFLSIQINASLKDSTISTQEMRILETIATSFGFSQQELNFIIQQQLRSQHFSQYQQQSRRYSGNNQWQHRQQQDYNHYQDYSQQNTRSNSRQGLEEAYALLEVTPDKEYKFVKKAYQRMLSKWHPDKVQANGGSQEMIDFANTRTQQIIEAFELICRNKGWSV